MKNNKIKIFFASSVLGMSIMSCSVIETKEVIDPNSPSVGSVLNNASKAQLDGLAIGHTVNEEITKIIDEKIIKKNN